MCARLPARCVSTFGFFSIAWWIVSMNFVPVYFAQTLLLGFQSLVTSNFPHKTSLTSPTYLHIFDLPTYKEKKLNLQKQAGNLLNLLMADFRSTRLTLVSSWQTSIVKIPMLRMLPISCESFRLRTIQTI